MIALQDHDGVVQIQPGVPVLRMLHTGDLCPLDAYAEPFRTGTVAPLLSEIMDLARSYDAVVTNLEAPLGVGGAPILKGGPNFRADPAARRGLQALGITHACLANNHIKDYGPGPIAETLALLPEAGITPLGVADRFDGVSDPVVIRGGGVTVALLNAAEGEYAYPRDGELGASCLNEGELMLKIRAARQAADAVVLRIHAGREYVPFPATWLRRVYQRLVDAGADLVVADHPHVPQGLERRGRGLILYSLGNFVFDFSDSPSLKGTRIGYAAGCAFAKHGLTEVRILPYVQMPDFRVRLLPPGADRAAFFAFLDQVSAPLADDARATAIWEEFVRRGGPRTLKAMKDVMLTYPPEQAGDLRKFFRSLSGAFNTCRTHLEERRLLIRLGYEERLAPDPAAGVELDAAADAMARLEDRLRAEPIAG